MSALKHGFFSVGFMLCDRCVLNMRCQSFKPGAECGLEKKAYEWTVKELMRQYDLEGLADEILSIRAAMYLIRIARIEAYEASVGLTDKSAMWGAYTSRLDNVLRGYLNDLAVTRLKRKQLDKEDQLMVSVDKLLGMLARRPKDKVRRAMPKEKRLVKVYPLPVLQAQWRRECQEMKRMLKGAVHNDR